MNKLVSRFVKDESGATAIEYGLIAALISVVIIGVLSQVGTALQSNFETIRDDLNATESGTDTTTDTTTTQ